MSAGDIVSAALAADIPVLLWGPPGVGKTAYLRAQAQRAGAHLEVLIGSTLDPSDVCGIPVPHAGEVRLSPPAWACRLPATIATGRPAWLMLDELSCAPPAVQAALLRVVHERTVGDVSLKGTRIVAAANPAETAADGGTLSAAMSGRWCHVEWSIDAPSWCAGEIAGWGAPRPHTETRAAALVTSFIARHPARLLMVSRDSSRAWPSPRSWSAAIRLLAAGGGAQAAHAAALVASAVGEEAAAEWDQWRTTMDLPDPEEILAGRVAVPARGDLAAAALAAMVAASLSDHPAREKRVRDAWQVLSRQRPDITLTAARALRIGAPEIVEDATLAIGGQIVAVRDDV